MDNLTSSSDRISEDVSAIIADLTLHAIFGLHLCTSIARVFSLSKTSGPTTKIAGIEILL